jgi:hypothetical protein
MAVDLQEQRDLANKLEEFNNGIFNQIDFSSVAELAEQVSTDHIWLNSYLNWRNGLAIAFIIIRFLLIYLSMS